MQRVKDRNPESHEAQQIDATLRLLATPRVPEGLEERLQRKLHAHQVELAQRTQSRRLPVFRRSMWIVAPLIAAAVLVLVVISHRQIDNEKPAPATAALPAQPQDVASSKDVAIHVKPQAVSLRHIAGQRSSRIAQDQAALLRSSVPEVSWPAPPAPLTDQERLLLAMARRSEVSSSPEVAVLLVSERVVQHGLAPEPPLLASSTTSE